jgi:hypothetical protein
VRSSLLLLLALGAPAVIVGCAQIIGADTNRELMDLFVDASDAVAPVPDAGDPNACPATQKRCNGACVPKSEPQYGCAAAACSPCSLPNTDTLLCTPDGLCASGSCKVGFRHCGSPTAGCTSDMTSPKTCSDCDTTCQATQVCNPGGCGLTCDNGLTQCDHSCVNTLVSALHCGPTGPKDGPACTNVCPGGTNGDAACVKGACTLSCRAGFAHCDGTTAGPCVPLQVFYKDVDGDGWGDTGQTLLACNAAAAGAGWSSRAGDCHDGNVEVNPGQVRLFPNAYTTPKGEKSWDYNCDGIESEQAGTVHFTPCDDKCIGTKGVSPAGSGRKSSGVNDYCGSTQLLSCKAGVGQPLPFRSPSGLSSIEDVVGIPACGAVSDPIAPNPCR